MLRSYYKAKRKDYDGITFRSLDEVHFYKYLKGELEQGRIKAFEYEPRRILLMPAFVHAGQEFKGIEYIPDFIVTDNNDHVTYYEVKGFITEYAGLKIKMFRKWLADNHPEASFMMVSRNIKRATFGGQFIEYHQLKAEQAKDREAKKKKKQGESDGKS